MKKFFFLFFLAASASVTMAQSQKLFDSRYSFRATLPEFSYNGQVQIFLRNDMDENGKQTFIFYSDEFEKQGELTVSGVEYNWSSKHEEREWKDDGYKGDWKVMSDDSGKSHGGIMSLCLNDFDQSCDDFRTIYLTQTLFNTDEKYEFLMPLYSSTIETGEDDRDGDGVVDFRYTSTNNSIIGFQIVSEDGTVLQTVNFDGDFTFGDSSLYSLFEGDITPWLSFSVCNHWASFGLNDSGKLDTDAIKTLYKNTGICDDVNWVDWAYATVSFGNFGLSLGKQSMTFGGFEFDAYDVESYETSAGNKCPSFLLVPSVITKDNLQELVDTGLYTMGADGYLSATN